MAEQEHTATGLEALNLITTLLQRNRLADPTAGVWEAADLQWWWRKSRRSDDLPQTFWFDDSGPVAACLFTDWGPSEAWSFDPIVCAVASDTMLARVWATALEQMDASAFDTVELLVRDDDADLSQLAGDAGFAPTGEGDVTLWMLPTKRPTIPTLRDGFQLRDRAQPRGRPHHMTPRNGDTVAERLAQCSLYRPDLDLMIEAPNGDVAAYGLFWFDPITGVGLVEPMRTIDEYQQLGLARFVLASGLDRLAALGCTRMKISHAADNPVAGGLYLSAGFEPESTASTYSR